MIKNTRFAKVIIYSVELVIIAALAFCIYTKHLLASIVLIISLLAYAKITNKYSEIVVLPALSKESATRKDYILRAFLHMLPYIIGIIIAIIWAAFL